MSHEDMLHLFDFERFLFDHVIPRDRDALQGGAHFDIAIGPAARLMR